MRIRQIINYWPLIVIILLAAVLRLWKLDSIPPHLTPDEASLGYNAYSILKTGRDEYGKFLPVIFKSFGDYKPGLYVYLTAPFVATLGLTEFAVRIPSALAGIVAVLLLYFIVYEFFGDKKLSLIASLFLAVSPWHIYFSRGAWEVNVSLTLTLAGIYFFMKSLKRQKFFFLSAIFFALTLLTYQGAKLSTAIVLLILGVVYFKKILSLDKKVILGSLFLGFIVSLPIIISLFQGKTGRLNVFSIFSYRRPTEYLNAQLSQGNEKIGDLTYYLFHSETLSTVKGIIGRYLNHFSARFLFFEGDWANPRHTAPYQGVLTLGDLILLILGFFALSKLGTRKEALFIWFWLILAPFPAALSRDEVHAIRSFHLVIPIILICSLGAKSLLEYRGKLAKLFLVGVSAFYLFGYIRFLDAYFVHLPKHNSKYWEYGYKQIVETITPIQASYKKIKVQQSFAQPYIYFLFYQKYDPTKYQKQAKLIESPYGDVGQIERLDNIYFSPIDWSINRGERGVLFVADTIRIPPEDSSDPNLFKLIKEIKYLNGADVAFRIIEVL